MDCETGFSHTSVSGRCLSVCRGSEGSSPLGTDLRVTDLYTAGWFDPDHDAVMRIGGEAPGGGPILSVGIKCQVRIRHPATSDRQFGSRAKKPARVPIGAECYARSGKPFQDAVRKSNRRWQSDVIVDLVKRHGFPYVALNPGASFRGLHDSLVNYGENDPPMLLCNHKKLPCRSHGYARASGKPMIAISRAAPSASASRSSSSTSPRS